LSLVRQSRGRPFCLLFNLRAAVRGIDTRIRYRPADRVYLAKSTKYEVRFRHEAQAYYACKRGIVRRTEILGETYFLPQIDFKAGDVVVDCGANVGELKYYFLENDLAVEYIGIEPSPLEYRCLEENAAPSNTYNVGLWGSDGTLDFLRFLSDGGFFVDRAAPVRRSHFRSDQAAGRPVEPSRHQAS
jgi:hypothetical protein